MKTEILCGFHSVFEALKAGRRQIFEIYFAGQKTSQRLAEVLVLAEAKQVRSKSKSSPAIDALAGTSRNQGIAARVGPYPLSGLSEIINQSGPAGTPPFLLLLDTVMDPHNLGALVRSAVAVGASGIIIPKDRAAPPTPAVSRTSAGALEHILLCRVTNMAGTITVLKENGLWVFGLERAAERSVFASDLTGPLALVVGGEGKGIRPLVKKQCDFLISIPQNGPLDSLNASVAGAVVLYEAYRQRILAQTGC